MVCASASLERSLRDAPAGNSSLCERCLAGQPSEAASEAFPASLKVQAAHMLRRLVRDDGGQHRKARESAAHHTRLQIGPPGAERESAAARSRAFKGTG